MSAPRTPAEWLRRRKARRLVRPRETRIIAGNAMSVSTGPKHAAAIFLAYLIYAEQTDAVVVGLSECSDFDGQKVADQHFGPGAWQVVQFGGLDSATSGTLLAVRLGVGITIGERKLRLLTEATPEGGGIRARYATGALLFFDPGTPYAFSAWVWAGHAPPPRAAEAQATYARRFRDLPGIKLGDVNMRQRVAARVFDRSIVKAVGVLAALVPTRFTVSAKAKIDRHAHLRNADHDGLLVALFPKAGPR